MFEAGKVTVFPTTKLDTCDNDGVAVPLSNAYVSVRAAALHCAYKVRFAAVE